MPYINIRTNVSISDSAELAIKTQLGQAITALPGKSEDWLMIGLQPEHSLWFQGTDESCALVDVSVYGGAPEDAYDMLTARVCDILSSALPLNPARIYIKYTETPNWGWNGSNF